MPVPRPALVPAFRHNPAALRPSEYTAALIHALRRSADRVSGAAVLEIGSGSGVVLAAAAALGAASLCGVDIEVDAVESGGLLLQSLGYGNAVELHHGDMWAPVADRRFDLILANLPHFPMSHVAIGDRLPTWSSGGADGRELLDPFLRGLATHLAPGGRAIMTHNAFVGLARSQQIAAAGGLSLHTIATELIFIPEEKLTRMTEGVLRAESGRTIHRYGAYAFAEMHVAEATIARSNDERS